MRPGAVTVANRLVCSSPCPTAAAASAPCLVQRRSPSWTPLPAWQGPTHGASMTCCCCRPLFRMGGWRTRASREKAAPPVSSPQLGLGHAPPAPEDAPLAHGGLSAERLGAPPSRNPGLFPPRLSAGRPPCLPRAVFLPACSPLPARQSPSCLTATQPRARCRPARSFVTPTLLAGDRSLANVVAHEIAHSWTGGAQASGWTAGAAWPWLATAGPAMAPPCSCQPRCAVRPNHCCPLRPPTAGNLVTNKSWEHFW